MSKSIEDYLEVILELSREGSGARITDIAGKLNIAKASASQAVGVLKKLGLVRQDKYGPVVLTEKGIEEASRVRHRHRTIKKFLTDVLEVDDKTAEKDACLIEHVVSPQTLEKILLFIEKSEKHAKGCCPALSGGKGGEGVAVPAVYLSDLDKGAKGRVVSVSSGEYKKRLLDMGLTPGAEFSVEGRAPLGDPIEIRVKGYDLTLRKKEAKAVAVEVL